jgi:hypothetical protein
VPARSYRYVSPGLTWQQVAPLVGYSSRNGEGVRYAAKRIGYIAPPREKAPKPPSVKQAQDQARDVAAHRALWLRREMGYTLAQIAAELGYSSKSSVTNLLKTVTTIESRMGRPLRVTA